MARRRELTEEQWMVVEPVLREVRRVGPTRRGKGTKIVAVASGDGLPLAVTVESASPTECRLVKAVLAGSFLDQLPARLIGDKAYNLDPLDQALEE